ncbi:Protein UGT-49, partial [Aphelenchoides avenae]
TLLEVEYENSPDSIVSAHHAHRVAVYGPFMSKDRHQQTMGRFSQIAFDEPNFLVRLYFHYKMLPAWRKRLSEACDAFIQRKDVLEQLRAENFDVFIGEQLTLCGTGLSHVLGIKTHIWMSSCPILDHVSSVIGIPLQTSYVPTITSAGFSDKMTYWERVGNWLFSSVNHYGFGQGSKWETEVFRKHFGPDFPDFDDIGKESPLTLVNVDEFVDFPRTTLHNIVYIGGLGLTNASHVALSDPFKSEVLKGKEGVVLVSLGSNLYTRFVASEVRENLLRAMSELADYHFIFKIDKEDEVTKRLASSYPNIFTTSWMPQPELLAHPRTRAFVTHGGYNSVMESARSAVPLLLMGFFADQRRNAKVVERNGWGRDFYKGHLTASHVEFRDALKDLLENEKYKKNAKRVQKLILTKPFSAEERLTKWMAFLEANGGRMPELMSEGRNLGFVEFYNFDIYAPLVFTLSLFLYALYRLSRFVFHSALRKPTRRQASDVKKDQ